MKAIEDAIARVIDGETEVFIPCENKSQQESIRVSAFSYRKRVPKSLRESIAIGKHFENDIFFVKIYKRDLNTIFIRNSEGILVAKEARTEEEAKERQLRLMREAGMTEEEIENYLKEEEL